MAQSWKSGDVEANGIRIHYTRTGDGGRPSLVLAHGFSDDGLCWAPLARALEGEYDVVMLDARGHGESDAPNEGNGSADQAADMAAAVATLGLQRPAILGHSMGAAAALALAGLFPGLPRAVLLEDPPAVWTAPHPEPPPADGAAAPAPPRPTGPPTWLAAMEGKTREELIAHGRSQSPGWSEEELGPWADSKIRFLPKILNRTSGGGPQTPIDWPATARRITCPALLITGDKSRGAIVSAEQAAELRSLVPHVEIAHIADAGHNIRRDQFAPYLTVVRAFLAATR